MKEYDVLIVGTGTAGQTAALKLAELGLTVAIADDRAPGGTCALRGCQPKKYLVVPAHAAIEGAALVERGFRRAPELDWSVVQRSRAEFTDAVPASTRSSLAEAGIPLLEGTVTFERPDTLQVGEATVRARRTILASGARPVELSIPGAEHAITSEAFLELERMPDRLVFLGGGYVSMEFATVAAATGASVSVVQRGDRVMKRFDADLVATLQRHCAARNIEIRTNTTATSIEPVADGGFRVHIDGGGWIDADRVVAAVGRAPLLKTLRLDRAGVAYNSNGITVDERMRSSCPQIYAIGDCAATVQLAPVADAEARIAAAAVAADLGRDVAQPEPVDYSMVPSVVFTYPQLAGFGISAAEASQRDEVTIHSGSGVGWPSYKRLNESAVGFKVMIDRESERILGAHILAPQAGELINLLVLAARTGVTAPAFRHMTWAYPTYSSDLRYMLG